MARLGEEKGIEHKMRKIHILGLTLAAMFAFGVVSAASASALEWLENGKAIAAPLAVDSEGTLTLTDMGTLGGESVVDCTGTNEGTVGPGVADLITKITATSCEVLSGPCISLVEVAKAVNLSWETELTAAGRDNILNAAGNPGWEVKCNTIIGEKTDICTGNTSVKVSNNANGTVDAEFDAESEKTPANCTEGGNGQGLVKGLITILATNGAKLEVG